MEVNMEVNRLRYLSIEIYESINDMKQLFSREKQIE